MKEIVASLVVGFGAGFLFSLLRLPVPAPPTVAGVVGIVGIFLGFKVARFLL